MALAVDLLAEWDEHNRRHRCYYESKEYDGYGECPSMYDTLGDFLEDSGLFLPYHAVQILGRRLDEPNYRSRISGKENPVDESAVEMTAEEFDERLERGEPVALSIRQQRILKKGSRVDSAYYTPVTDEVLRDRSEKAKTGPVDNQDQHWEVMAMEYFKNYLDRVDKHLHNISMVLGELNERLDRIEDAVNKAEPVDVEEVLNYGQRFRTIYEGY